MMKLFKPLFICGLLSVCSSAYAAGMPIANQVCGVISMVDGAIAYDLSKNSQITDAELEAYIKEVRPKYTHLVISEVPAFQSLYNTLIYPKGTLEFILTGEGNPAMQYVYKHATPDKLRQYAKLFPVGQNSTEQFHRINQTIFMDCMPKM